MPDSTAFVSDHGTNPRSAQRIGIWPLTVRYRTERFFSLTFGGGVPGTSISIFCFLHILTGFTKALSMGLSFAHCLGLELAATF